MSAEQVSRLSGSAGQRELALGALYGRKKRDAEADTRWWVNGKQVIAPYNDRHAVVDDGVSKRLTLNKNANVIRAAIINAGGATD